LPNQHKVKYFLFSAAAGQAYEQARATLHCEAIKNSLALGLFLPSNSHLQLKGFCDLDWTTSPHNRKSKSS